MNCSFPGITSASNRQIEKKGIPELYGGYAKSGTTNRNCVAECPAFPVLAFLKTLVAAPDEGGLTARRPLTGANQSMPLRLCK
jgi:hypothetical protein